MSFHFDDSHFDVKEVQQYAEEILKKDLTVFPEADRRQFEENAGKHWYADYLAKSEPNSFTGTRFTS